MIRFQADADLRQRIVDAVRLREPSIDFASAADSKLEGIPDPQILEIAASESRILITHDRRTTAEHFRARLEEGKSSPGVFLVSQYARIGEVVEAIVTVWAASEMWEWENQLRYLLDVATCLPTLIEPPLARNSATYFGLYAMASISTLILGIMNPATTVLRAGRLSPKNSA